MFSITRRSIIMTKQEKVVSVPSRGLCFQSISRCFLRSSNCKFPSPLGDYVFNLQNSGLFTGGLFVSVPSRGLCFQSRELREANNLTQEEVSVPSRGLCFQSLSTLSLFVIMKSSFRPLSGIMFSILVC